MQKSSDIALDGNRDVFVHGISEPFIKKRKQGEMTLRYHVVHLLRTVEIPEHVTIKRLLGLGRWQGVRDLGCRDPQPTLVEFANPRHRDKFLEVTRGEIITEPDDAVISDFGAKGLVAGIQYHVAASP